MNLKLSQHLEECSSRSSLYPQSKNSYYIFIFLFLLFYSAELFACECKPPEPLEALEVSGVMSIQFEPHALADESNISFLTVDTIEQIWKRYANSSSKRPIEMRRSGSGSALLLIDKYLSPTKVLAVSDKVYLQDYPSLEDVWFNNMLEIVAWRKNHSDILCLQGDAAVELPKDATVLFDPSGRIFAIHAKGSTSLYDIRNPNNKLVTTTDILEAFFYDPPSIFLFTKARKKNVLQYEHFRTTADGEFLIFEKDIIKIKLGIFGLGIDRTFMVIDMNTSSQIVVLKDTTMDYAYITPVFGYSLPDKKAVWKSEGHYASFFLQKSHFGLISTQDRGLE